MFVEFMCILGGLAYMAGKGIQESVTKASNEAYMERKGYNQLRQHELVMMAHSAYKSEREEFDRMAGRVVNRNDRWDVHAAVRDILESEGWNYFDLTAAGRDPEYVKSIGGKMPYWMKPDWKP